MLYNELEQGDILSGVRWRLALLAYTDILLCSIWAIHRIRQTPVSFFQFLRNFRYQNAFEQTELILWAALDPAIARRARRGELVRSLDHFDLLQTAIN